MQEFSFWFRVALICTSIGLFSSPYFWIVEAAPINKSAVLSTSPPAQTEGSNLSKSARYSDICLNAAHNLRMKGEFSEAVKLCKKALKYSPACEKYETYLSECLNEEAIEHFKKAHYNKALHLFEEASYEKLWDPNTKYNITKTIEKFHLNPNLWSHRIILAKQALKRNDEPAAIVELRAACELKADEKTSTRLDALEQKYGTYDISKNAACYFTHLYSAFHKSLANKIHGAWSNRFVKFNQEIQIVVQNDSKTKSQIAFLTVSSGDKQLDNAALVAVNVALPLNFDVLERYGESQVQISLTPSDNLNTLLATSEIESLKRQQSLCRSYFNEGDKYLRTKNFKAAEKAFRKSKTISMPSFELLVKEKLSDCLYRW